MDGIDFCRHVRSLPQGSDLPLILMISTEQKAVRHRAFEAGATDVRPKNHIEALFTEVVRLAREHDQICAGRVLYVEDSITVATAMLKILGEMHLSVDHYKNAADAFAAFERTNYDLVISDILVEGAMTDFGLVSRIRADAERS